MSQYSVVLSPGVTFTTVVLEDDTPLDDAIDELQHTFTLYQRFYGDVMGFTSTETFTFNGKTDCRELYLHLHLYVLFRQEVFSDSVWTNWLLCRLGSKCLF